MSERHPSPLRYPGGKTSMADVLGAFICANGLQGCTYVEPFAGGAGAAIKLLRRGYVDRILINDADRAVFSFWKSILTQTERFIERVCTVRLTVREWRRQRDVYRTPQRRSAFDLGFAAFFLNRCNRSGIIRNGGPIGGIRQTGEWKIGARFNRDELARRIKEIGDYRDRIDLCCEDAALLLERLGRNAGGRFFVYADPPYYVKGEELYLNAYQDVHHSQLAATMAYADYAWVMSYDDVPRIRELYNDHRLLPFDQRYSAHHDATEGAELLIVPDHVNLPEYTPELLAGRGAPKVSRAG